MVDEKRDEGENSNVAVGAAEPANLQEEQRTSRYVTVSETDEEDDDDREQDIQLGPQYTLKEQIEKDKDDESLRKWKEQLLGSVDFDNIGETLEPEVRILSLSIVAPGRNDIVLAVPEDGKPTGNWFTLKEGSKYSLKFTFEVSNNIVSGLKYTNTVWKAGIKAQNRCLEPLVLSQSLTYMRCPRRQPLRACLLEDRILQEQSFLMMITSATWRSTIPSTSEKNGLLFEGRASHGFIIHY
ncbi:Rho GDP-dissociation inhibitor 1 [Citrus sinensis]|uniref:Rho GDP-dissociation inhibitor 1 n=1 Tax=Citrus sinensis TaxID=2711 RepID=A0ACB8N6P8_CITSI|nr:Rho GDP-dissociation inhibitor 1 [Citrus sinensis]